MSITLAPRGPKPKHDMPTELAQCSPACPGCAAERAQILAFESRATPKSQAVLEVVTPTVTEDAMKKTRGPIKCSKCGATDHNARNPICPKYSAAAGTRRAPTDRPTDRPTPVDVELRVRVKIEVQVVQL